MEENGWKAWQLSIAQDLRDLRNKIETQTESLETKIDGQSKEIAALREEIAGWKGRIAGISTTISVFVAIVVTAVKAWLGKQ